jgi:hypothetical protein
MPISRDFKGGGYASGGPPFKKLLTSAAPFYADAQPHLRARRPGTRWSLTMDPTNIALWLILIAMIAIIPCGCVMTRPREKQKDAPSIK